MDRKNFKSAEYWEQRYAKNGNSGLGSYGELAAFKSRVVNSLLLKYDIQKVLDWGCGDGNQISTINFKQYVGLDVSKTIVLKCREKFKNDKTKIFHIPSQENLDKYGGGCDMTLSLDVLFHLIEDDVYQLYLDNLVKYTTKFILVYSCNFDDDNFAVHVKPRSFQSDLESRGVKLVEFYSNPFKSNDHTRGSFSDFYLFSKV